MWWLVMACGGKLPDTPDEGTETKCDGKDDDGDGAIDEGLEQVRYPDEDGDGWGVTDDALDYYGCLPEEGWAGENGDCDDGEPAVNPDAAEVCGDAVDDDCDGVADGCNELDPDHAAARYQPEAYVIDGSGLTWLPDADGAGNAGFAAIATAEYMDDAVLVWAGVGSGTVYSVGATLAYDEAVAMAAVDGGLAVGTHAAGLGRLDVRLGPATGASTGGFSRIGDGAPGDVGAAVGAGEWLGEPSVAWAYEGDTWGVALDPLTLSGELAAADAETTVEIESLPGALLRVPGADGTDGLLVVSAGATLFEGPFSGSTGLAEASATFSTQSGGTAAAAVADLDGDGTSDVAIGDASADAVAVWLAPGAGDHTFSAADARVDGTGGTRAGAALAALDDLGGDGLPELVVQGPTSPGGVWILSGPWKGTIGVDTAWRRVAEASEDYGTGVTGGDIDGDGLSELLLGGWAGDSGYIDLYTGAAIVAGP